ncbi:hypothetical protein FJY71_08170 [candidate division WOR-3 bacterium]|nr:hypothetical protein [candidate division WOR-3 bacterium]
MLNPRGDSVVLWVLIPHILETELVADTAAGQLWLVTGYGEQLLVFDCSLLRVIDSVRVSPHSHAPVWIDGERKIYAFGSESLLVVSAEQRQVIKRIPLDYTPGGFKAAYDSERNRLYVYRRGEVMAFDCRRDSLCWTLPGQTFTCIALNAPGRELFGAYGKKVTVIRDTTASGVGEGMAVRGAQLRPPTVVRSVLPVHGTQAAILVNAAGRRVMELVPGANDVRHLSPGVYFVCSQPSAVGRQPSAVQKVVVTK